MKRAFLAVFVLCIVAACGGGGGGSSSLPINKQPSGQTGKAAITIVVPNSAKSASALRTPKYIVPGTQSVAIQVISVNGVTPNPPLAPTIAQIGPGAPGCTTISTGVSCTINVNVPYATSLILQISSFSSTDGSGTALAVGTLGPIDSTQPNPTPFPVALGGVIGSLVVTPTSTSPPVSSSGLQTFTFTVSAKDGSGNIILPPGSYSSPITLAASNNTSGAISFSTSNLVVPPPNGITTVTMTFDPTRGFTGTSTITASASNITATMNFTPQGSGGGGLTVGPRVFEYAIPSGSGSKPWQITVGPDNASLWFTENGAEKFGAVFPSTCTQTSTPTCTILEGSIPQTNGATMPTGIVSGPNGLVWIGGTNSTPTGHLWTVQSGGCSTSSSSSLNSCAITQQPDPVNSPSVYDMKMATGNLIMAGMSAGGIGYLLQLAPLAQPTPSLFSQSGSQSQVFGVDANSMGTAPVEDALVGLTCGDCGSTSFYSFQAGGNPQGIISTSNGYSYVADAANSQIVQFVNTSCSNGTCIYNPVSTKTAAAQPEFLAVGADGNIYFTEFAASKIGVLNVTNVLSPTMGSEIPIPTANAGPWGITLGPDGNIWFTEYNTGKIGVVVP